jgi:hypothetical protein
MSSYYFFLVFIEDVLNEQNYAPVEAACLTADTSVP